MIGLAGSDLSKPGGRKKVGAVSTVKVDIACDLPVFVVR